MRPLLRLGWLRAPATAAAALARLAGVPTPPVRWRRLAGPYFGNAVSTLVHRGRAARVTIEGTTKDGELRTVADVPLNTGNFGETRGRAAKREPRSHERNDGFGETRGAQRSGAPQS